MGGISSMIATNIATSPTLIVENSTGRLHKIVNKGSHAILAVNLKTNIYWYSYNSSTYKYVNIDTLSKLERIIYEI